MECIYTHPFKLVFLLWSSSLSPTMGNVVTLAQTAAQSCECAKLANLIISLDHSLKPWIMYKATPELT